jgi:arginine decarboxylase
LTTRAAHEGAVSSSPDWSPADAAALYGIDRWGRPYFSVNDRGHVAVHPTGETDRRLDLKSLVDEMTQRGLSTPLLLRFAQILEHRMAAIQEAFARAIDEFQYEGGYCCVYPIKVNQQAHVVRDILRLGRRHGFGLEAGSKPELLAVMALVDDDQTPIICNGFKDAEFIEGVILAEKIGKNIIPVVEKFSELRLILDAARRHEVKPTIGIRVKLAARGAGRWEMCGGPRSKFGLTIAEALDAIELLGREGMGDALQLLHFHLGSQVTDIRQIKKAITEAARVYVGLREAGAYLRYLDVGGGLSVDYEGNRAEAGPGVNYTLREYANDVVYYIRQVCAEAGAPHPTIFSESGRAIAAHHSVLVFDVLGRSKYPTDAADAARRVRARAHDDASAPAPLIQLADTWQGLTSDNLVEYVHDAQLAWDQVLNLFNLGYCELEDRAMGEKLYFAICTRALEYVRQMNQPPADLEHLESFLAETYFCNFSVFQSLPDNWAIGQVFPVMPIHRLDERPTARAVLVDMTCDSDGRLDRFVTGDGLQPVLHVHPPRDEATDEPTADKTADPPAPYRIGVFLVGAYQEVLGDMHNLFGDPHAVHVRIDEHDQPILEEVVEGDTVREMLNYVQFEVADLKRAMRQAVEKALRDNRLTLAESRQLIAFYESGLEGYTYLE